jgi:Na+/melibiose symporter-like transporter
MIVVGGVMCGITFVILFTVLFFRVRENKRIQRVEEEFKIEQRRDAILKAKLEREERKIVEENRKMEEKAKREKPIE